MASQSEAGILAALITPGSRAAPGYDRPTPRDRVVDVAFVGVGFLLGALGLGDVASTARFDPPGWLIVTTWIGSALSLALRRRWPVGLAVALIVLSVFFPPVGGPSVLALFSAAVHRSSDVSLALCGAGVASGIVQFWIYPPAGSASYWVAVGITALGCLGLTAWGMVVRTRRELMASLTERAVRAEAEQRLRVEQGRRQERERIAREMHDALGHRLSLLSVHAGAVEFRPDLPPDELSRIAGVIRSSARDAVSDLRDIVGVLRSHHTVDGPHRGIAEFDDLVADCRSAGLAVEVAIGIDLATVPESVGRHAYRIAQEGLTNARKHAPGQPVRVAIDGKPGDGLTLEIINPLTPPGSRVPRGSGDSDGSAGSGGSGGYGGSGGAGSQVGLIGLGERASLVGGRIEHGETRTGDFRLAAWLPWPKDAR
ncbi:signal transduction histidine kinase [Kribbella voronezhensis]|uniref:histidine kinase n=1 Tax=Kribbella voronezhensis TaxID=2512212 RepID=A0A4R7T8E1_9ACTN|nr:histidine kinase [Kribbella voronezhensis]TDU88085.1 signal transduction histidine kinase [Kribbella voronezhensis]